MGLGFRDRKALPSPWNTLPHLRSTLSSKAPFAQVAIYVSVSPRPGEAQVASGPQSPYRTGKVLGRGAVGLAGRVPSGTQSCLAAVVDHSASPPSIQDCEAAPPRLKSRPVETRSPTATVKVKHHRGRRGTNMAPRGGGWARRALSKWAETGARRAWKSALPRDSAQEAHSTAPAQGLPARLSSVPEKEQGHPPGLLEDTKGERVAGGGIDFWGRSRARVGEVCPRERERLGRGHRATCGLQALVPRQALSTVGSGYSRWPDNTSRGFPTGLGLSWTRSIWEASPQQSPPVGCKAPLCQVSSPSTPSHDPNPPRPPT